MMMAQERPAKKSGLHTVVMVLRLLTSAPGILLKANREYRQFRAGFLEEALAQGLPEAVARDIMAAYRPLHFLRDLNPGQKERQSDR